MPHSKPASSRRRGGGGGNGSRSYYTGAKHLDDDDAYHARVEAGIVLNSQSLDGTPSKSGATNQPNSARKRGPQDSGKGVRVMVRDWQRVQSVTYPMHVN